MQMPDWLRITPTGLELVASGAAIDPPGPRGLAIITHAHADHARPGHGEAIATPETLAIMAARDLGPAVARSLAPGRAHMLGDVRLSLHPAGHVLGSAQVRLEGPDGTVVVISGDYKRAADPSCAPFEPVPCDIFVTEATFALPVFRHPPAHAEMARALARLRSNPDRALVIGAYALGKAQRLILLARAAGHAAPIYIHGALARLCDLYSAHGAALGELLPVAGASRAALAGQLVLAPPSALGDARWLRRLPDPILALASGWMRIRARARQRGVELPLVISDHADWDELTATIGELRPRLLLVTHGREEALVHWASTRGIAARALNLAGRDEEAD
jgi:putative mRNA 3-end processing factor